MCLIRITRRVCARTCGECTCACVRRGVCVWSVCVFIQPPASRCWCCSLYFIYQMPAFFIFLNFLFISSSNTIFPLRPRCYSQRHDPCTTARTVTQLHTALNEVRRQSTQQQSARCVRSSFEERQRVSALRGRVSGRTTVRHEQANNESARAGRGFDARFHATILLS